MLLTRLLFALLLLAAPLAAAQHLEPTLPDPAQEARAHLLSRELRCLVCQNQSIDESNAPLARDLRRIVRERIAAGDSDAAVLDYLVTRYGEWVLLKPRFNERTLLLWLGPALLLLAGGAVVLALYRRQRAALAQGQPAALNEAERRRVEALLKSDAPGNGD